MAPLLPASAATVLCDGTLTDPRLDHPEGLAVDRDGAVWCGGEQGQLYRIEPDGSGFRQVASTGGFVLGVALDGRGNLYACDLRHAAVFRLDTATGVLERFADFGGAVAIPNWPVVDAARGVLYVSDSHAADEPGGGVWRVDLDTGTAAHWYDRPLTFANGMALAADGGSLLVAETFAHQISRITIGDDGRPVGDAVPFVTDLPGLPDGLAFDTDGNVYVGCYEPSRVLRVTPDGQVDVLVEDPTAHVLCHPTNVAFRGDELLTANLGRWHVTRIAVGARGVPLC